MILLSLALGPIFIIAMYLYYRDKYEKEPWKILLRAFLSGAVITIPIIFVELYLDENYWAQKFSGHVLSNAAYDAFVVAAFTEEIFKFAALYLLVWRNHNFNEKFDGIVYAAFVSLGFAAVENLLYVLQGDSGTGVLRALTAVPGHAIFGVAMGYYLGLAKFTPQRTTYYLVLSLFVPILLHGVYDFILMSQNTWLLLLFLPYIIFMWYLGFKKMRKHSDDSVFK